MPFPQHRVDSATVVWSCLSSLPSRSFYRSVQTAESRDPGLLFGITDAVGLILKTKAHFLKKVLCMHYSGSVARCLFRRASIICCALTCTARDGIDQLLNTQLRKSFVNIRSRILHQYSTTESTHVSVSQNHYKQFPIEQKLFPPIVIVLIRSNWLQIWISSKIQHQLT